MSASRPIRHDHDLLRQKLALLESALSAAPETRYVLREMSFSLHRALHDHLGREAQVVYRHANRLSGSEPLPKVRNHGETVALLKSVNDLFLSGMEASMPTVVAWLRKAVQQLKAQMSDQETRLYPVLEEGEAEEEGPTAILGTMSVNEILHRYPQAEGLFAQLRINRVQEGYKSVDELAWTRGLDVSRLLDQLRQAIGQFPSY